MRKVYIDGYCLLWLSPKFHCPYIATFQKIIRPNSKVATVCSVGHSVSLVQGRLSRHSDITCTSPGLSTAAMSSSVQSAIPSVTEQHIKSARILWYAGSHSSDVAPRSPQTHIDTYRYVIIFKVRLRYYRGQSTASLM